MIFPLCNARKLLIDTPAGVRVSHAKLFQSFTPAEQKAWYAYGKRVPGDVEGIMPAEIEQFLAEAPSLIKRLVHGQWKAKENEAMEPLKICVPFPIQSEEESSMATTKELTAPKRKRAAKKKPEASEPATATPSSKGASIAASKNGDDPDQTYIEGTVDEPIPALDRDLKKLAKVRTEISNAKDEEGRLLTSVARRMHENQLNSYKGAGYSVIIVPSAENVKVKPAKDK